MYVRLFGNSDEDSEVLPRIHRKVQYNHIAHVDLPMFDIAHTPSSIPTGRLPERVGQLVEPNLAVDSTFVRTSPGITVYTPDELVYCAGVGHRNTCGGAPFQACPVVHA